MIIRPESWDFGEPGARLAPTYAGSFAIPYDALDIGLRLVVATMIGMGVAAMGLATACAPWAIVGLGVAIFIVLMILFRMLEAKFHLKDHD